MFVIWEGDTGSGEKGKGEVCRKGHLPSQILRRFDTSNCSCLMI